MQNSTKSKSLYLIDGTAMVYRSFHAFAGRGSLTSRSRDVSMIFGFISTLLSLCRREKPDLLGVAFDTGAPTFRHKMFDQYKANRPPMDEGMRAQLPVLYDLIDALNFPRFEMDGYEADDLMGTLAQRADAAGMRVFLVTGDKDFYQLVGDNVSVYTLSRSGDMPTIYDVAGVLEKFGVLPDKVIDVLGLMGDTSDNIPGVPKVGPKTAVELVRRFGGLDEALASAAQVKQPKLRESLVQYAEQARFSRELAIIDTLAPIELKPDALAWGPLNNPHAHAKLVDLEFASILNQIEAMEPRHREDNPRDADYIAVTDAAALEAMVEEISASKLLSIDLETTSTDPMTAELVGMSFAVREQHGWYVSVNYFEGVPGDFDPPSAPWRRPNCSRELAYILDRLKPVYANPLVPKAGQNLKYDAQVLACYDVNVEGIAFDTLIASFLLDPEARQRNIDQLAETHLGIGKIPTSALIGSGAKQISMADVPLAKITEYACEDADVALRLTKHFQPLIEREGYSKMMYELEIPLMAVLLKMERIGVALDVDLLERMSVEFQTEIDDVQRQVLMLAGVEFNLNSTQQLAEVLYDRLGLPKGRKTKSGYSTDTAELERLAPVHEMPRKLLRYRHLAKLKSTYIDALPKMINPITGRVHTSYSQTIAATGRLSSTDPNLQNIPIRSEEGGRIRRAFVAGDSHLPAYDGSEGTSALPSLQSSEGTSTLPPLPSRGGTSTLPPLLRRGGTYTLPPLLRRGGLRGGSSPWLIVSADYSQIELRIMAHLSGDKRLADAFRQGQDIHRATAAWMFDIPQELVASDMRRQAKEVNFGVLYGMGEFGLSTRLGISRASARDFIDRYFTNFARVKEYIDELLDRARKVGYVETMMGRRRPLPDLNAKNFQARSNAERIAINTPIQGSAADLIKIAMIRIDRALEEEGFAARMLMQVHDELVFEAPPDEVERLAGRLKQVMGGAMELDVPLDVDVSWGESWLDAHE